MVQRFEASPDPVEAGKPLIICYLDGLGVQWPITATLHYTPDQNPNPTITLTKEDRCKAPIVPANAKGGVVIEDDTGQSEDLVVTII